MTVHRERLLYVVVGAWNTVFTYASFALLYYLLHARVHPSVIVLIAYVVSSTNGFIGFRYLVFRPVRHPLIEYLRYQLVYAPLVIVNMIVLPLALEHSDLSAYLIQALFAVFAIVVSYLGNKYFTFRRSRPETAVAGVETTPIGDESPRTRNDVAKEPARHEVDAAPPGGRAGSASRGELIAFDRRTRRLSALMVVLFCLLVGFKVHYSSIEEWNALLPSDVPGKSDSSLIAGKPKMIRSDEWRGWTPRLLRTYLHRENLTRSRRALDIVSPWNWGFYVLGLERGYSFMWNFWVLGSVYAVFLLMMLLSRNRFGVSLFTAILVLFSSYNRWWGVATEVATVGFLLVSTVCFLQSRRRSTICLAFLGVCVFGLKFALSLYPPWQVTLAYLMLFVAVGFLCQYGGRDDFRAHLSLKIVLASLALVAALAGGVAAYLAYGDTLHTMSATVYPGRRLSTGGDVGLYHFFSGYLDPFLRESRYFYLNICESSGFILLFPFVIAAVLLERAAARAWKVRPLMVCLMAYLIVLSAYMMIGFGALLSRLTLLNSVPGPRAVFGAGLASILLTGLYVVSPPEPRLPNRARAGLSALSFAVFLVFALGFANRHAEFPATAATIAVCAALAVAVGALVFRQKGLYFAVMLGLVIWPSVFTNPVAGGLQPIYGKRLVQAVERISADNPGALWLVYSDVPVSEIVRAGGADVFNGMTWPPRVEAMRRLDPTERNRPVWNRFARIYCLPLHRSGEIRYKLVRFDEYWMYVSPGNPRLAAAGVRLFVVPARWKGVFPSERFRFLTPEPLNGYLIAERATPQGRSTPSATPSASPPTAP